MKKAFKLAVKEIKDFIYGLFFGIVQLVSVLIAVSALIVLTVLLIIALPLLLVIAIATLVGFIKYEIRG